VIPGFPNRPLPGLRRELTDQEARSIDKYLNLLSKWQRAQRLVGSTSRPWLIENVLIDSLRFLELIPKDARRVVDIGSGAGIPGIPVAVVRPSLEIVMVEAMRRRVSFLATVIRELALINASVVESRVEQLGPEYDRAFDVAVMRCAGTAESLVPRVMTLVKLGGTVVASSSPHQSPSDALGGELVPVAGSGERRYFRRWRL
jgi:16S rRNA (guanine527-N7)-methyltransferase